LPETVSTRMVNAVKVILNSLPEDVKTSLWNSIDPEKRKALQVNFKQLMFFELISLEIMDH
jgi:hypothetical protein